MLSIFLCAFCHQFLIFGDMSVKFSTHFFWLGFFFFIGFHQLFVYFEDLSFIHRFVCKYFLTFWGLSFHLIYGFLCVKKLLSPIKKIFFFPNSRRWVKKILPLHCWGECNTLATWCEELTHWKRPCCWEGSKAEGEWDNKVWDGWMVSPTQWTWVWAGSGSWW